MSDVINLGKVRKRKAKEARQRQAAANRVAHGRTRDERRSDRAERKRTDATLDGARREPEGADPPTE